MRDDVGRFLERAMGKVVLEWEHEDVRWRVHIAHTHGDVIALAVWCDRVGYLRYQEVLASEFLRRLRLPPAPVPFRVRLRRALQWVRSRLSWPGG